MQRVDLAIGRSFPVSTPVAITRASIANPDVADAVVISEHELVVNAKAPGETDIIMWLQNDQRRHYRVMVHSPADRMQIALQIKFAEIRRDVLRQIGVSALYRDANTRAGTGIFRSDNAINKATGDITLPNEGSFLTVLSDFNTDRLLALIEVEEQKGNARILSQPSLMAGNKEEATFLAGGELPIPVAQSSAGDATGVRVTIQYREFGIRLRFLAEIISDSLIKLAVRPEVSSLDYANAVIISGFRVPALRTRRVETTMDVRRSQSLMISGLFNNEQEKVKTGIPLLMDIPILGNLFSSTRWQKNETELVVVVTPVVFDPMRPPSRDILHIVPDSTIPAREVLKPKLAEPVRPRSGPPPS